MMPQEWAHESGQPKYPNYTVIMVGSGMGKLTKQSQSEEVSLFWLALLRKRYLTLELCKNLTLYGLSSPCEVDLPENEIVREEKSP